MAWSTRQLADLAATTVKAVRYYHDIGVLDLPERATNGYKQYEVPHLVRLLQIKRLSDLGVPLSEVAAMERIDDDPDGALRVLDSELEETIARLTRIRAELAVILRHRAPAYLPPEFASMADELNERQRSLLMVYSTVLSEKSLELFRKLINDPKPTDLEFEALPADADDATIMDLARRMRPEVLDVRVQSPWVLDLTADAPRGREMAEKTMAEAMMQLYNPAQLRLLGRLHAMTSDPATGAPTA